MLEGYFLNNEGIDKKQRLLAVQAALEIAKASVTHGGASANHHQTKSDLQDVTANVEALADAIQAMLNK